MNKLIMFAILVLGSFQLWERYGQPENKPLYDEPYVVVYGRNSCSFTREMISDLESSGINYKYFIVDEQATADSLHSRMEAAGISTRRYNLPVVDTNGIIKVRPDFDDVLNKYNNGL